MMNLNTEERRQIIQGLSLDVDILARELYADHMLDDGLAAVQAIDRMAASLARLREQLTDR